MKNLLLIFLVFVSSNLLAQQNFVWEKTDTVAKTKDDIYSDTKMFIAENWKSAKAVIQNDDKEGGLILVKGKTIQILSHSLYTCEYTYSYNVVFRMKDQKYKITIDNVYCESAYVGGRKLKEVQPFEGGNVPEMRPTEGGSIPKKKLIELMSELKSELQNIVDDYTEYLNGNQNSDW